MSADLLILLIAIVVGLVLFRLVRGIFRFINRSLGLIMFVLIGAIVYLLLRDRIAAVLVGR